MEEGETLMVSFAYSYEKYLYDHNCIDVYILYYFKFTIARRAFLSSKIGQTGLVESRFKYYYFQVIKGGVRWEGSREWWGEVREGVEERKGSRRREESGIRYG